jgi:hypothetical protein
VRPFKLVLSLSPDRSAMDTDPARFVRSLCRVAPVFTGVSRRCPVAGCYRPRCRVRSRMKRVSAQRSAMTAGSTASRSRNGSEVNPDRRARELR